MAFSHEFNDVTRALEPYRMAIFIDDLDRCNPGSVTQILESVNFLTSSGDCFAVMGLAKEQVEASIGLSFRDVAEELGDGEDVRKKRRDYAEQYLRKLINLEVKVPAASSEQQRLLLVGRAVEDSKPKSYAERLADFGRANRPIAWTLGTVVLAIVCFCWGLSSKFDKVPKPLDSASPAVAKSYGVDFSMSEIPRPLQRSEGQSANGKAVSPSEPFPRAYHVIAKLEELTNQPTAATPEPNPEPNPEPSSPTPKPKLNPPPKSQLIPSDILPVSYFESETPERRHLEWLPVLPGLLLFAFGYWIITRRPDEIVRDSRKFTIALEIWEPVIGEQYRTPREIKRFVNRIRYIAMRWRRPSPKQAPIERFFDRLQRVVSHTKLDHQQPSEINEAGIVLMAALEGLGGESVLTRHDNSGVENALLAHMNQFGKLGVDWQRFREITGEVGVN